ncbi:hypothetical protein C0993_011488 [Termitomyces sp. T159_Od127]|nr:hypothetical protein C0993_011488 [Termitomyces sp. T159_Od127]
MSQFLQVLPIELIDIIIDYLDTDLCALKACSLVCKAWQARSRHHLFRSINLDLSLPPKSLNNFLCHVSRPVSHFHITIHSLSLRSQCSPKQQYNLAVLASLRSLTHLTLLYWNVMPDSHWFSGSPNVTYLKLESCRVDYPGFVALLQQFPKLECLQLKDVSWRGCFDIKQAARRGKVLKHVRRFHLGANSMPVVPELTALMSTGIIEGKVEEVVLEDVEMRNERIVGELLTSVGTSLRSLVISAKSRLSE